MGGVSGIGGIAGGGAPIQPKPSATVEGAPTAAQNTTGGAATSAGQSLVSMSSTSISASSESLLASNSPVLADQQLLGLVVLMLTLEYLQSDDEEEKKGLLALMLALSQQQSSGGEQFMYSSSSLSIESTQIQAVSSETAMNGYTGGSVDPQQVPGVHGGAGGTLDAVG